MRLLLALAICLAATFGVGAGNFAFAGSPCNPNIQNCP